MMKHLLAASAITAALTLAGPAAAQSYGSYGQNYGQPYGQQPYQQNAPYGYQGNPYGHQQPQQPYGYGQPAQPSPYGYGSPHGNTQGGAYGGYGGQPSYGGPQDYGSRQPTRAQRDLTVDVETALSARGYDVGTVDSKLDARSRAAIRAYERDAGLPITGQPSQQLLAHIESSNIRAGGGTVGSTAGQVIDRFLGGQQWNR